MNRSISTLSHQATKAAVQQAWATFGQVTSAKMIKNRISGQSHGFAFVEMSISAEAEATLVGLAGNELLGQLLVINAAHPRTNDRNGGGRRGGSGPRSL